MQTTASRQFDDGASCDKAIEHDAPSRSQTLHSAAALDLDMSDPAGAGCPNGRTTPTDDPLRGKLTNTLWTTREFRPTPPARRQMEEPPVQSLAVYA